MNDDLETVLLAHEWLHDLEHGLVPSDAHRPLFPHERQAGFNALSAETEVADAAQRLTTLLINTRTEWLQTLAADLRSRATPADAVARLIRVDANLSILGAPLLADVTLQAERIIGAAATAGVDRFLTEAVGQAARLRSVVPIDVAVGELGAWVKASAVHVARSPLADITGKVRGAVTRMAPARLEQIATELLTVGAKASVATLESDYARVPVQQAWGRGRHTQAATITEEPRSIYASELLDKRVCRRTRGDLIDRCNEVDGREYPSRQAAWEDYPTSTYLHCLGGMRCRGTLVYVWKET